MATTGASTGKRRKAQLDTGLYFLQFVKCISLKLSTVFLSTCQLYFSAIIITMQESIPQVHQQAGGGGRCDLSRPTPVGWSCPASPPSARPLIYQQYFSLHFSAIIFTVGGESIPGVHQRKVRLDTDTGRRRSVGRSCASAAL